MKTDCEVIRDLLPLYTDDACSEKSRTLVDEHLAECPACRELLIRIRESEVENKLMTERTDVLRYGEKRFKRRSAMVGSVMSGIFLIPILVCLIVNLASGFALDWFFIVLASLMTAASLIIVPLMVPKDKALWTLCAFTMSLMVLLAVVCIYSRGTWFWVASSASLFGLAVIFLPFVVRAEPVQRLLGGANRALVILGLDVSLFINMMNMIASGGKITFSTVLFALAMLCGFGLVILEVIRKRGESK